MYLKAAIVCAAFGVITGSCPQLPSAPNATLADFSGTLQYLKYYKSPYNVDQDLDGMVYRFDRHGDSNNYTFTVIKIFDGGHKEEKTFNWVESPTEQKLFSKNPDRTIIYSIPFLDKGKSAVFYTCVELDDKKIRSYTQVITPDLDNDLTKAIEEAKKIAGSAGTNLTELPYNFKNAIPA